MPTMKDGTPLENGLVVSERWGEFVAVFRCRCGREQKAEHPSFDGGITIEEAKYVGWRYAQEWICPFCTPALPH